MNTPKPTTTRGYTTTPAGRAFMRWYYTRHATHGTAKPRAGAVAKPTGK